MAIARSQRGFALLIAVIFMSVMLSFGLALGSLSYKQQVLASSAVDSQFAFYAADAGLECAIYADQVSNIFAYPQTDPSTVPQLPCDNTVPVLSQKKWTATSWVVFNRLQLDSNTRCTDVTVYKPNGIGTTYIFSQGYSAPCTTVASPQMGSRIVTRGISVQYSSAASAPSNPPVTKVIFLKSGSSWTVPADWASSGSTIEVIGGGGGGADSAGHGNGGGGGGAYTKVTDVSLTPGSTVSFTVGSAGSADSNGGDTYFCNSSSNCGSIGASAVVAGAKGGSAGNGRTGGAGGSSGSSVGTTKNSGGAGGTTVPPNTWGGGGGGGAAGSSGNGANGGTVSFQGGGGGGGANGGPSVSSPANGNDGAAGGAGGNGGNGGNGGTSGSKNGGIGASGNSGGGGGGGYGSSCGNGSGGNGGSGVSYTQTSDNSTAGPGGGGGGEGDTCTTALPAGNGGLYGGGGAGAADDDSAVGGSGAPGIIIITYTTSGGGSGGGSPVAYSRAGWALDSSTNSSTGNAIDGDASTRWTTFGQQSPGQYFQVDMGTAQPFMQVVLDDTQSPNDYPRGYQLYVSNDGVSWSGPIASGSGSGAVTTISVSQTTARYIKVVQTGSDPTYWWSIHELNIYHN